MPAEAYRKDDTIVVVHGRTDGQVYYHRQHVDDRWVSYAHLGRMDSALFEEAVAEATPYDVRTLPALTTETED
ncbi:MAG: hypothetical protein GVY12_16055 [Bacteroidetes bacterium]|jgi:hypothetical protein|nr:hypothetical protein [Bacteroidota bacterium]